MAKGIRNLTLLILFTLIPTLAIWAPFFFRLKSFWGIPLSEGGMATVVANYDGPLFLVVAKTLYDKGAILDNFSFNLPTEYYPAHFPLYPILIRLFGAFLVLPYAMLFVTILSSFLAIYFFFKLISQYYEPKDSLWITAFFSIFPARWLIVRSVGSAEPLFLAAIIASIYYFQNKKYLWAGIWGAVSVLTKSAGILLFLAYLAAIYIPHIKNIGSLSLSKWIKSVALSKILPIFFIPISLIGVFIFYKIRVGDFFAYFRSGDNIHLFFPPFQIFNYTSSWVGTFWLEEIIFVYLFGLLGLMKLIKNKMNEFAWFTGIFFVSTLFVSHRDLIRYSLPIVPFLFVAFADTIVKKEFKIVLAVLALPIYLFSLAYISQNVMQISDWSPFL